MFVVNTSDAPAPVQEIESPKPATSKRTRSKPKAKTFSDVTALLSEWQPGDVKSSRKLLSSEIMSLLSDKGFSFVKACIPSIVVEGQFPIDLMHYHSDQDIYEFLTRMMWMHQEYGKALGVLVGVTDEAVAAKVEEACGSLLEMDKDCMIILA